MMPFASADSYDPWQVFKCLQYRRTTRRKVSTAPKVSWSCSKTVTFCYVFATISPSEWFQRAWNLKNCCVLTFSQLKTISRVVWWCRLLLRIAMIPSKCLKAYSTIALRVERFSWHQKWVEVVQKSWKIGTFCYVFATIFTSEWLKRKWNVKNGCVLTFSQIKTISRVVWWYRLLLQIAMIPGKCLETHSTIALCLEKFLRHQKSVEFVPKSSKISTFCYVCGYNSLSE